jgi:hypothetical protein
VLFPTTAHLPYLAQTSPLPQVGGSNPLQPIFYDPRTGQEMQAPVQLSLTGVGGVTSLVPPAGREAGFDDRYRIGRRTFSLSKAWPNRASELRRIAAIEKAYDVAVPCYQGPLGRTGLIDWRRQDDIFQCFYRNTRNLVLSEGDLSVPVMFHISGRVDSAAPDAEGTVLISLSWGGHTRHLGGRRLQPKQSGDFVVRGAAWEDIRNSSEAPYRQGGRYTEEINLHGSIQIIPIDDLVTLNVYLVSSNGKQIGWRGEKMVLYHPTFALREEQFDCGYSSNPTRCANPSKLTPRLYLKGDDTRPLKLSSVGSAQCLRVASVSVESDPLGRFDQLTRQFKQGRQMSPTTWWERNSGGINGCAPVAERYACPVTAALEIPRGCYVRPPIGSILEQCRVPALLPGKDQVQEVALATTASGSPKRFVTCSGDEVPACARPHAREVGQAVISANVSEQSCPSARVVRPKVHTVGPMDKNSCNDASVTSLERYYRDTFKIPVAVPVTVSRETAPPRYQDIPPATSCAVYSAVEFGKGAQAACGLGVSWQDAQRCCDTLSGKCRVEQSSTALNRGAEGAEDNAVKLAGAVQRAVAAVQAAYPRAAYRPACAADEQDCLEVSGGVVQNDSRATMTARMKIPLLLVRPFGVAGITIEHSADRALERMAIAQ